MTSDQPPPSGLPGQESGQESGQAAERREAESADAAKAAYAAEAVSPWSEPGSPEPAGAAHRRTAWLPLIGAGLASGALVVVVVALATLVAGRDNGAGALDARLARIEQQMRELASRPAPAGLDAGALAELTSRLARLEAAVAAARPAAADPALGNRLSAIEGAVKALSEQVGILNRRSDEAVAAAREARTRADANAAALAELAQKRQAATIERSEFDALASRVAAVERGERAVEAELAKRPPPEAGDRAGRLALAASALNAAVERGAPFAVELAAVKALAGDSSALAPLEPFANSGVPSAAALSRELTALLPSLRAAAGAAPRDGFLEKLQAHAEQLVRVRPLQEVAGADAAAIIARIEVKAAQADVAGALAELGQLPQAARAPAEAWINRAQARSAALAASRRLAADTLAGLGK